MLRIKRNKKLMIPVIAMILVVAMAGNALAVTYDVGNGYYSIWVFDASAGDIYYTHAVEGINSRSDVTTYIMNSSYGGWRGTLDTYKAWAFYNEVPISNDRVRFHSFADNNEFRIDPTYTSNYVGDNFNQSSRYVTTLQRALYHLGYLASGDITGVWNSTTKAAVISFQQSNYGISVDGIVGNETWSRLASYGC